MDQRFLEETVRRRPALFEAIVAFNRGRLCTDAASSVSSVYPLASSLLLGDAKIRRACNSNAHSSGWWDFSEETRRIVLLKPEQLRRLALCFSAAVHAEELAHILDRQQVIEIRTLLGNDVFTYAIRRGRYQIGSLRHAILERLPAAPLAERLILLAHAVLQLISTVWPEELRRLWRGQLDSLRLIPAKNASEDAPLVPTISSYVLPQLSREQHRALWFTLKKILLREAAPQWAPCFD